jgi:hypothetical protein
VTIIIDQLLFVKGIDKCLLLPYSQSMSETKTTYLVRQIGSRFAFIQSYQGEEQILYCGSRRKAFALLAAMNELLEKTGYSSGKALFEEVA